MSPKKFSKIAESLRQYRRAELKDFQAEIPGTASVMEALYVDPLKGDAVLQTVLSGNTTFLIGRKGTGKSTIFAKAQSDIRKRGDLISVYVDVKSIYELINASDTPAHVNTEAQISSEILRAHLLRKSFLSSILAELIKEISEAAKNLSLWERWLTKKRNYDAVRIKLGEVAESVSKVKLSEQEIPILQLISKKTKDRKAVKETTKDSSGLTVGVGPTEISGKAEIGSEDLEETIADNEIYKEYSDAILRSFPFAKIIEEIKNLLDEAGMIRVVVFFDDFSELGWSDQKLFVDVILAPLNNASDERIKLKIAGYPGRIYYGKIDPGKVDTIRLDFFDIYKSTDIQSAENSAIEYTHRLLQTRFQAFGEKLEDYFEPTLSIAEYMRLIFETTLNVPRLIGYLLHNCYLDRVSKDQLINAQSLRLSGQKYYEGIVAQYFDRASRFALEPFEQKLDRHNQKVLLNRILNEAKEVRKRIITNEIGGTYFAGITNPPASHFTISPKLEQMLASLEMNFLVSKYHEMRDKDGADISVFALCYGLCESERFPWGYPRGRREDRSYFVQRCFNYNSVLQDFLAKSQTIRCGDCGFCHPMEKRESLELYKWKCPECSKGICKIVKLSDEFTLEVAALNTATMLDAVELEILETLHEENMPMKAGQISSLVDATYQRVGRRTAKLQQMGLVNKSDSDGVTKSSITTKARLLYFSNTPP